MGWFDNWFGSSSGEPVTNNTDGQGQMSVEDIAREVNELGGSTGSLLNRLGDDNPLRFTNPSTGGIRTPNSGQHYSTDPSRLTDAERQRLDALIASRDEELKALNHQLSNGFGEDSQAVITTRANIASFDRQINILQAKTLDLVDDLQLTFDQPEVDFENRLHKYINLQYHIDLTMISQDDLIRNQKGESAFGSVNVDPETNRQTRVQQSHRVIASTGDSNTDPLQEHYYNITALRIQNVMDQTPENPIVSTMTGAKMTLVDPKGFDIHERVRDYANQLGYTHISNGRIGYLVTIGFSGYDQNTGEWEERIEIASGVTRYEFIGCITDIQATIDHRGTVYTLDISPFGSHAERPEDNIFQAINHNGATVSDALQQLSTSLEKAKSERTDDKIKRVYEFYGPPQLMASNLSHAANLSTNNQVFANGSGDLGSQNALSNRTVTEWIQAIIDSSNYVQRLWMNRFGNEAFTSPRIGFSVRYNSVYNSSTIDPDLGDYAEITHQYIIEPFLTFKKGDVSEETINAYMDPQNQRQRVREMMRMGMLRRIYNYFGTSENNDVLDFDVNLKSFYYENLQRQNHMTTETGGHGQSGSAMDRAASIAGFGRPVATSFTNTPSSDAAIDAHLDRVFGKTSSYRTEVDAHTRLGGGFNDRMVPHIDGNTNAKTAEDHDRISYERARVDYLSNQLMVLDGMRIKGDPVWFVSPYTNIDTRVLSSATAEVATSGGGSDNLVYKPRTASVMFINMRIKDEQGFTGPTAGKSTVLGGFYNITSVESIFENGHFTQHMSGAKIGNLNYVEENTGGAGV